MLGARKGSTEKKEETYMTPKMTFAEFFEFYKGQHKDPRCRWMHFHGIHAGILAAVIGVSVTGSWWAVIPGILTGYAFSIPSHAWYEGNKPASFGRPWWRYVPYSFMSDWRMWFEIWQGKLTIANPYRASH